MAADSIPGRKAPDAFRTISELAAELGVAQHILRYWETKFPQLKPLQRAGNRRYYRPADVAVAKTIHRLLTHEGYSVRGVAKVLEAGAVVPPAAAEAASTAVAEAAPPVMPPPASLVTDLPVVDLALITNLRAMRDELVAALAE
jgi:DNA-binding transcriptional MerR regulator